jgi:hypothetical protein
MTSSMTEIGGGDPEPLPEFVAEPLDRLSTVFGALGATFMVLALPSRHVAGF